MGFEVLWEGDWSGSQSQGVSTHAKWKVPCGTVMKSSSCQAVASYGNSSCQGGCRPQWFCWVQESQSNQCASGMMNRHPTHWDQHDIVVDRFHARLVWWWRGCAWMVELSLSAWDWMNAIMTKNYLFGIPAPLTSIMARTDGSPSCNNCIGFPVNLPFDNIDSRLWLTLGPSPVHIINVHVVVYIT